MAQKINKMRRHRSGFAAVVGGACMLLSGCVYGPPGNVPLKPNPQTLVYTYLMAHGMARGYVMSGGITKDELINLLMVDHTALLAVATETAHPTGVNMKRAGDAVQVLLAALSPKAGVQTPPSK